MLLVETLALLFSMELEERSIKEVLILSYSLLPMQLEMVVTEVLCIQNLVSVRLSDMTLVIY